jgi:hypothetical protein
LERLYKIRRAAYKPDDVTLIVMMNNVAIVRFNTGDFAGATEMQRKVVDAHRKRESPDSPSMELGYSVVNLGIDLRLSGEAAGRRASCSHRRGNLKEETRRFTLDYGVCGS